MTIKLTNSKMAALRSLSNVHTPFFKSSPKQNEVNCRNYKLRKLILSISVNVLSNVFILPGLKLQKETF